MHIVQRGHSGEPVFFEDSSCCAYLHWLEEVVDRYDCVIHACVLETNHTQLLVTLATSKVFVATKLEEYLYPQVIEIVKSTDTGFDKEKLFFEQAWIALAALGIVCRADQLYAAKDAVRANE